MKNILYILLLVVTLFGCKKSKTEEPKEEPIKEYLSVKIDGVLWESQPNTKFASAYSVKYNAAKKQLSMLAENVRSGAVSYIQLSLRADEVLKVGSYPSVAADFIGITYTSENQRIMFSVDLSAKDREENTTQITKIDKTNPNAYIIEGTFSAKIYSLGVIPIVSANLTEGKFRVVYHIDSTNPAF